MSFTWVVGSVLHLVAFYLLAFICSNYFIFSGVTTLQTMTYITEKFNRAIKPTVEISKFIKYWFETFPEEAFVKKGKKFWEYLVFYLQMNFIALIWPLCSETWWFVLFEPRDCPYGVLFICRWLPLYLDISLLLHEITSKWN